MWLLEVREKKNNNDNIVCSRYKDNSILTLFVTAFPGCHLPDIVFSNQDR